MKALFRIDDSTANKISYYHVMLLLLSLPFDMFYSHLIIISLAIHTVIQWKKESIQPVFTLPNLLLSSVFILTLLSTLYSANKSQAFTELGRQVTMLLMPLICCFNSLNLNKYRNNLLLVFSLGCVAVIIYLFLHAIITIQYFHLGGTALFSPAFINHNFSLPLDIHATYLSMQIAVALVYLLVAAIKESVVACRWLYTGGCILLAAGIIQLSSKSIFIALLLIISIAVPCFLLAARARMRFIFIALSCTALLLTGIYQNEHLRERYLTGLEKDLSQATDHESSDPRLARWQLAINVGARSPVIGHGAGSETGLLKASYFDHKLYRSYLAELNAHNQFISFFIKSGLLGVLLFGITLYFGFRVAVLDKDVILFAFMFIITTACLSENILDRDKGIYFYSVFFSFLYFSTPATSKKISWSC